VITSDERPLPVALRPGSRPGRGDGAGRPASDGPPSTRASSGENGPIRPGRPRATASPGDRVLPHAGDHDADLRNRWRPPGVTLRSARRRAVPPRRARGADRAFKAISDGDPDVESGTMHCTRVRLRLSQTRRRPTWTACGRVLAPTEARPTDDCGYVPESSGTAAARGRGIAPTCCGPRFADRREAGRTGRSCTSDSKQHHPGADLYESVGIAADPGDRHVAPFLGVRGLAGSVTSLGSRAGLGPGRAGWRQVSWSASAWGSSPRVEYASKACSAPYSSGAARLPGVLNRPKRMMSSVTLVVGGAPGLQPGCTRPTSGRTPAGEESLGEEATSRPSMSSRPSRVPRSGRSGSATSRQQW
jgi:hypothetical protein